MLNTIFSGSMILGAILLFCWAAYALIKKYWPTTAATQGGQVLGQVVDKTQEWAAYVSLTAIRQMDSIEADPRAVEACEYLRNVITAWRRPIAPVAVKPVVTQTETPTAVTTAGSPPTTAAEPHANEVNWSPNHAN